MREFTSVLLGARFHAAVFLDGPLSLSLSLLSPSPFPLISIADQRARRGRLRCSALPGYWIYCIWLRSGFALPLPSLCLPPSVRLAAPSLPPFFPAVGLRIKIRHFIVSKFCEADNIAAPIAAAERRGRARAGTLRCWFCYRINRLSDRFRATNKANEPPSLFNRLRATRPVARLLLRRRPLYMGKQRMGPPLPFDGRSKCDCSIAHWIILGPENAKWLFM